MKEEKQLKQNKTKKQYEILFPENYENGYVNSIQELQKVASEKHPVFTLDDGNKIYRPLTIKENMEARIDNSDLFRYWCESSTGILFKENSYLAKINPVAKDLFSLNNNTERLIIPYVSFEGNEVDFERLNKKEKWMSLMGGITKENSELYDDYQNSVLNFQKKLYDSVEMTNRQNWLRGVHIKPSQSYLRHARIWPAKPDDSEVDASSDFVNNVGRFAYK